MDFQLSNPYIEYYNGRMICSFNHCNAIKCTCTIKLLLWHLMQSYNRFNVLHKFNKFMRTWHCVTTTLQVIVLSLGSIQMRILYPALASLADYEEYFTQGYFFSSNFSTIHLPRKFRYFPTTHDLLTWYMFAMWVRVSVHVKWIESVRNSVWISGWNSLDWRAMMLNCNKKLEKYQFVIEKALCRVR